MEAERLIAEGDINWPQIVGEEPFNHRGMWRIYDGLSRLG
jgi:hypothetical protein